MGRRGRKRQLDVEARYWALLMAGVGTVEACRQVGVTRKTGYRWRFEVGGIRPDRVEDADRHGRSLSRLDRQRIASLRGQGVSMREIGRRLGRSASTISRELKRNTARHDRVYDGDLAHARARQRARRPKGGRLLRDPQLRALVEGKLALEWSPEQIAGWLKETYPDDASRWVCHETIYQALYCGDRGLARTFTKKLRTGRPLRKRRRRSDERSPRFIAPAQLISQRPAVVEDRSRIGDWEGDLIIGRSSRSAIGTLVDRASRYVRLVHLPFGHRAEHLVEAMAAVMATLPADARLTLTWDQGSEMAGHDLIAPHFREGVYFAPPGTPCLRGTNENHNGLLRQYFPKGSDLSVHTAEDLRRVEDRLNGRPRKMHHWRTAADIFAAVTG